MISTAHHFGDAPAPQGAAAVSRVYERSACGQSGLTILDLGNNGRLCRPGNIGGGPVSFEGDEYARRTLDFVQGLQQLTKYDDICRHVIKELEWFGFTSVTSWSLPGPGCRADEGIVLNTRPQAFIERYVEKNYVVRDPLILELRKTVNPFSWTDVRERRDLTKSEKRILDEPKEFGACDGLIIPIVSQSGSISVFSPCGQQPNLSPRARAAVEIIGVYSHHALTRVLAPKQREDSVHTPLTPRELEILRRCKDGKSRPEIGEILSISKKTVEFHLRGIMDKLGASNQLSAVVIALQRGLIEL
jgi:DNA-binding CsgD family transcriptional regulator